MREMVVVPLSSILVDGKMKWVLSSERGRFESKGYRSRESQTGNKVESSQTSNAYMYGGENKSNSSSYIAPKKHGANSKKSHTCNICSNSLANSDSLRIHMRRHNPEKLFKCDKCSYGGNQKGILEMHVRSVHDGKFYHCDDCDFKTSQKSNLKTHTKYVHEGIIYRCDQCSFIGKSKHSLEKHKEGNIHKHGGENKRKSSKQAGARLACDECDYNGSSKQSLKLHKQLEHEGVRSACDTALKALSGIKFNNL